LRKSGERVRCFSLAAVCVGIALLSADGSAAAQGGSAAHGDKPGDAAKKKDVRFEVFSIRPSAPGAFFSMTGRTPTGFVARINLFQALEYAYLPGDSTTWGRYGGQTIQNLPDWASGMNLYDISAHVPEEDMAAWRNQGNKNELLHSALQAALKERCKMVVHQQPTVVPDYQLVIAKKGLKLKASVPGAALPAKGLPLPSGGVRVGERLPNDGTRWRYYGATIGDLVDFLSLVAQGRQVHDMTGLTGRYDFTLELSAEPSNDRDAEVYNWPVDQLGLELKQGKEPGFMLVVDHIERPTPN